MLLTNNACLSLADIIYDKVMFESSSKLESFEKYLNDNRLSLDYRGLVSNISQNGCTIAL